ncbi:MAG: Arm DNA-binding domain-containing protein [Candidatus Contendobacter sp.]|nr:Arm DNA-binding domain-containing protein [Candidatus Contendobacter sp.]
MSLTDLAIRSAKPGERPVKLFDERGLYLQLNPSGSRWWRVKYRFAGKAQLLSAGVYPEVSLKETRQRRDEIRRQVRDGRGSRAAVSALRRFAGAFR